MTGFLANSGIPTTQVQATLPQMLDMVKSLHRVVEELTLGLSEMKSQHLEAIWHTKDLEKRLRTLEFHSAYEEQVGGNAPEPECYQITPRQGSDQAYEEWCAEYTGPELQLQHQEDLVSFGGGPAETPTYQSAVELLEEQLAGLIGDSTGPEQSADNPSLNVQDRAVPNVAPHMPQITPLGQEQPPDPEVVDASNV